MVCRVVDVVLVAWRAGWVAWNGAAMVRVAASAARRIERVPVVLLVLRHEDMLLQVVDWSLVQANRAASNRNLGVRFGGNCVNSDGATYKVPQVL